MGFGDTYRGYIEWNISSIPDGATITDTKFQYDGWYHGLDCHIHDILQAQPSQSSNEPVYHDAGNGTVYADPDGFPVVGDNQEVDLGASADSDLQSQLSSDWFAIGLQGDVENSGESEIESEDCADATPKPTLVVTYTTNSAPTIGEFQAIRLQECNP